MRFVNFDKRKKGRKNPPFSAFLLSSFGLMFVGFGILVDQRFYLESEKNHDHHTERYRSQGTPNHRIIHHDLVLQSLTRAGAYRSGSDLNQTVPAY